MMNSLSIIPEDEILDLVKLLENDIPDSIHPCHFLKCIQEWKRKKSTIVSHVWAPGGDFTDATFILHANLEGVHCYTMYSISKDGYQRLEVALNLADSSLIVWEGPFLFTCLSEKMSEIAERVLISKLGENKFESNPGHVLWLPVHEAAEMSVNCLPDDVYISKLKPSDSQCINDVWPHRYPGSRVVIEDVIRLNGGFGVYSKEKDELLAWALNSFYGGLGVVQTAQGAQRKGYASAVVQEVTRYMAQKEGYHVHLNIVWDNKPSLALFRKLGFRHLHASHWISLIP